MSKAFTREGEGGDELPPVEDTSLPPGVPNYLTPAGADRLRAEIERLREALKTDRRLEHRLALLLRRLEAAQVIDPAAQPVDRVLFGARVRVRDEDDRERTLRIVGIDEADARAGRISWRSPMARALLNRRLGEQATVHTPSGDTDLEIVAIDYPADDE